MELRIILSTIFSAFMFFIITKSWIKHITINEYSHFETLMYIVIFFIINIGIIIDLAKYIIKLQG